MVTPRCSVPATVVLSVSLLITFLPDARSEEARGPSASFVPISPAAIETYLGPFWLGVEVSAVSKVLAAQLNIQDQQGLVIDSVISDSPAERAGLEQYDILTAVNGVAMTSFGDLQQAIQESRGKEITLKVIRAGQHKSLTAIPADQLKLDQPDRTHLFLRPLAAYIVAPPELPDGVTVVIRKTGTSPVEVVVTHKEQAWNVTTDGAPKELPDELRRPVMDFLRQPLAGATWIVEPLASRITGNDHFPSESQALSEIVERLKSIEAKLGERTDD